MKTFSVIFLDGAKIAVVAEDQYGELSAFDGEVVKVDVWSGSVVFDDPVKSEIKITTIKCFAFLEAAGKSDAVAYMKSSVDDVVQIGKSYPLVSTALAVQSVEEALEMLSGCSEGKIRPVVLLGADNSLGHVDVSKETAGLLKDCPGVLLHLQNQ